MNQRIAFGVFNQIDRIDNVDMYLRAKGATMFYLRRLPEQLPIYCADQIHEALQQALDNGHDYCVMLAAGCQIKSFNFVADITEFIDNNHFGVAGHPLWKPGCWLELHHQFFIVNLVAWNKVGRPEFGHWEKGGKLLPVVERSRENFHDDYTPLWIKPTGDVTVQADPGQGWQLISEMMMGNWPVITLSEKIRLSKFYTYPEHETAKFINSIKSLTPYANQNWNQNKWIEDSLRVKDQIWLFNSEHMSIDAVGKYSVIANTASGFKILDFFKQPRLADDARAVIYDFNTKSLAWYEHFYRWKGNELIECIRSFPGKDFFTWIGQTQSQYTEDNSFNEQLQELYRYFGGVDQFNRYWKQFRQMPAEFHQVDLYNDPGKLAALLIGPGRKWINLSNIFSTDATQLIFGHAECAAAQQRCLMSLYIIDPNININLFDFWNRNKCGEVKNIL